MWCSGEGEGGRVIEYNCQEKRKGEGKKRRRRRIGQ